MKQKYGTIIVGGIYDHKSISSSMMQAGGLIIILDCLYGLSPALNQECSNFAPPLQISPISTRENCWKGNERRLESKILTERKEKLSMKILKTQGRIYFARK
jgi:hypothetical protein